MQVRRELQRSIVVRALHDWFCTFGNCHIVRTWQTGSVFSQWSQTSKQLGINGDSCQPTDSGSIAIVSLYRTTCEWGTIHCVVLLRSWFDFHSTCSQFVRPDSGRFLAQLRLRFGSSLPMSGHFAGTASLCQLLLTVLWTKLSTWTVFVATVTLRYNGWSDGAPAYNLGRVYAS